MPLKAGQLPTYDYAIIVRDWLTPKEPDTYERRTLSMYAAQEMSKLRWWIIKYRSGMSWDKMYE